MSHRSYPALILSALLSALTLHAQKSEIHVRAHHCGDSVLLRWVPVDYSLWQHGNSYGYKITRYTLDEYLDNRSDDSQNSGTVIATSVKPIPRADSSWTKLATSAPASVFVQSAIYERNISAGSPEKRKQEENLRFGFSMKACDDNVALAKQAGLFFTDNSASRGQQYVYKIEFMTLPPGVKSAGGTASADEKHSVLSATPAPIGVFRNRKVALIFDVQQTHSQYAGYIIERSVDSIRFERVNSNLVSFTRSQFETDKHELTWEDSIPQNGIKYWYRVRGYSYFGIEGPPSIAVSGSGREEWSYYPLPDTVFSSDNKTVTLKWHYPSVTAPADFRECVVLRAEKVNGKYYAIAKTLPAEQSEFSDTTARFTGYYIIAAVNRFNDTAASFPVLMQLSDLTPPESPENIQGNIDSNGVVKIMWHKSGSPDVKGYRVFRCNSLREEFFEVTDSVIPLCSFTDSIEVNTLTREVYYSVRAVDHTWNNSEFSKPLLLRRPDKIPPVAPVITSFYHTDSTLVLQWIRSSSKDISGISLMRSCSGKTSAVCTFLPADTISHFVDTSIIPGMKYSYIFVCTDSSGNKTSVSTPELLFSPRVIKGVTGFTAAADREKQIIKLSWDIPTQPVDRFIIYKCKDGEVSRSYKTLKGNVFSFTDTDVNPGNVYVYKIRGIASSGSEMKLQELRITY